MGLFDYINNLEEIYASCSQLLEVYKLFKRNFILIYKWFKEEIEGTNKMEYLAYKKSDGSLFIEVSEQCIETYPCYHYVRIDGVEEEMDGVEIYRYFIENGEKVPSHFAKYSNTKYPYKVSKSRESLK